MITNSPKYKEPIGLVILNLKRSFYELKPIKEKVEPRFYHFGIKLIIKQEIENPVKGDNPLL